MCLPEALAQSQLAGFHGSLSRSSSFRVAHLFRPSFWLAGAADCWPGLRLRRISGRFIRGISPRLGCQAGQRGLFRKADGDHPKQRHQKRAAVVRMEVPCCGGLEMATKKALQQSGKFIPWQVVTVTVNGSLKEE